MNDEILLAIGRLEGKVDSLLQMQKSHTEELDRHEARIRSLESHRSTVLGAAGVIGGAISFLTSYITHRP
jgi:TolA-binding protein